MIGTLTNITRHPLNRDRPLAAVWRFASWQIRSRLARRPIEVPFVSDSRLLVARGMTGATGNIYCGLHEFEHMALAMHALRPGDLFADVGANVGAYTILASGVAGADGIAFEPAPAAAAALRANLACNRLEDRTVVVESAVGDREGTVAFTTSHDSMNHVASPGETGAVVEVKLTTLDDSCAARVPTLLKIDVEGNEGDVLRGARRVLADQDLKAAIVEAWNLPGEGVCRTMEDAGFFAYSYDPVTRVLSTCGVGHCAANVLFVRDIAWLTGRCRSAPARLVRPVGKYV